MLYQDLEPPGRHSIGFGNERKEKWDGAFGSKKKDGTETVDCHCILARYNDGAGHVISSKQAKSQQCMGQ